MRHPGEGRGAGVVTTLWISFVVGSIVASELILPSNDPLSGLRWLWRWCPCKDCAQKRLTAMLPEANLFRALRVD